MKKLLLYTVLFFYAVCGYAQNLVVNPSFEDTLACPTGAGEIQQVIGWNTFRGSPDYFNSCAATSTYYSVPSNGFGYQQAASGNAYAGIICFVNGIFAREIIADSLVMPLSVGQQYFISFKVNKVNDTSIAGYSINKLGAKFSTVTYTNVNIDNTPLVYTNSVVSDTLNWTRISGSFIADSAYKYLMIGNFFDDTNTTFVNTGGTGPWAYYLIDDICLSTDSLLCSNFSTSVREKSFKTQFSIYPNPVTNVITIQNNFNATINLVAVYNSLGQILYVNENINANNFKLDIGQYNDGLLFIKITSQNNQLIYKLLKQ